MIKYNRAIFAGANFQYGKLSRKSDSNSYKPKECQKLISWTYDGYKKSIIYSVILNLFIL
jgi:hypothetical protein